MFYFILHQATNPPEECTERSWNWNSFNSELDYLLLVASSFFLKRPTTSFYFHEISSVKSPNGLGKTPIYGQNTIIVIATE